ncbi:MAG TPA: PKD domain-containing protein [Phnomibacter sp.]|nr:PKD domain-containing protein [Phnomibacter sp.]
MKNIKISTFIVSAAMLLLLGCEKEEYSFGDMKAPADLSLTTAVEGANTANPDGNGSGRVVVNATAQNALTYRIDFGDGTTRMVPSGNITYKYTTPGTREYTITVSAIGKGGVQTVTSQKVNVFVLFEIPVDIVTFLTNDATKRWATDQDADGHFGVGPNDQFSPIWYAATPGSREACAYDDVITFTKDANGNISINVDNKGESFSIGASTAFYGFGGGDGCYPINTGGTKTLKFYDATTGSTSNVSRQIEFEVPGNGIINFGTGGRSYEIIDISATQLHLRSIGSDGNAWYMKLKAI